MSNIIAGHFPAEVKVQALSLQVGDTLMNGDVVAEVRPIDLFPGAVLVRFEVDGMSTSQRVHETSQYRVRRQVAVAADWSIVEEPALAIAA
ncbi:MULTISPECIES: hypothetical protein [unclassified Microbacterium]|uniref:hypothetical protein n=1 Tax=unclassified Microbacterium TaxID=2609290 RepID=UPI002882E1A5|nr:MULTISPECIES: hypothetical protein [unclassified Microbacterium]